MNTLQSDLLRAQTMAHRIAEAVAEAGGTVYYVGGCVRDALRGVSCPDIDLEVHGITPQRLCAILSSLGEVLTVGESFGIYTLKGYALDIAMPRSEKKRGGGHRDFAVCVDPALGIRAAARRRDFTVNAMLQNVLTGEISDPFGGRRDLEDRVLRHVCSETFSEDPLRVLRAAQFAARFGFSVAPETRDLCEHIDLSTLPRERVMGELQKALLGADRPSVFFETLRSMRQLKGRFAPLASLIDVPQPPRYHAEGDVWNHTMLVLDEAAKERHRAKDPLALMLAALTHDFGKALCTAEENGILHAYRHETEGLPLIEAFLRGLTNEKRLICRVLNLCEYHMKPNRFAADRSSVKATNLLFDASLDPDALLALAAADARGSLSADRTPSRCSDAAFLAERLALYRDCIARPRVTGKDLIAAGIAPSVDFSALLAYARRLHLAGLEKSDALRQTLAYAKEKRAE